MELYHIMILSLWATFWFEKVQAAQGLNSQEGIVVPKRSKLSLQVAFWVCSPPLLCNVHGQGSYIESASILQKDILDKCLKNGMFNKKFLKVHEF